MIIDLMHVDNGPAGFRTVSYWTKWYLYQLITDKVGIRLIGKEKRVDQMVIRPNGYRRNGYWSNWLLDEMVIRRDGD